MAWDAKSRIERHGTRDLQDLAKKGIFVPTGGRWSTHYQIKQ
jgi:hypothetical protein